jgi:hypothetical protein
VSIVAMTATTELELATPLLVARLKEIREQIERTAGIPAAGPELTEFVMIYNAVVAALPVLAPERTARLMTTAEMAAKLRCTPPTVRRKAKSGVIEPPVRLGKRGRSALRWRPEGGRSA